MKTVKEVLDAKGRDHWSITPEASASEAASLMVDKEIGALLVMQQNNLLGLVSERDFARKLIASGRPSQEVPVAEVMATHVVCVRPEQGMDECMALMTEKRVRHLPVLEDGRISGIVSIGDAVKSIIEDQQFIIEQLETYISS
jgi:signal-transduction protein with cAMP-binding, CBS, and nucleotidyltransferase domain